mmetsp:Transcript_10560/g.12715  ORF Transcript_10560/g.12715 Transcript_10560/m.12715 type:complete len:104 (+) Transcript_10560:843-1154(+)
MSCDTASGIMVNVSTVPAELLLSCSADTESNPVCDCPCCNELLSGSDSCKNWKNDKREPPTFSVTCSEGDALCPIELDFADFIELLVLRNRSSLGSKYIRSGN